MIEVVVLILLFLFICVVVVIWENFVVVIDLIINELVEKLNILVVFVVCFCCVIGFSGYVFLCMVLVIEFGKEVVQFFVCGVFGLEIFEEDFFEEVVLKFVGFELFVIEEIVV